MAEEVLFNAKNITKVFQSTVALQNVSFQVKAGEVVGLVGENGAGKSTLLKIMIGFQQQTEGSMSIRNQRFAPNSPIEANDLGLGMVFQEQSLITSLTVGQNIFFGHEKGFKRFGFINWKKMYRNASEILCSVGLDDIKPEKIVSELDFARRQMVEIAKVINLTNTSSFKECLILLDEPTSVLNGKEVERLFSEIKKLKAAGHGIVFVSHRLDEVIQISDKIYVFKDGKNVGETDSEHVDESKLYEMMVGHSSSHEYYRLKDQNTPEDKIILEADDLGFHGEFKHVSFKLHKGEILSFCGVVGSGKEKLCSVLCGDEPKTYGRLKVHGEVVHFTSPHDALSKGILMIPKERNEEGVVGYLSVADNITLSNPNKIRKKLLLSRKRLISEANDWIAKLRIKTNGFSEDIVQLSGGNAQKVVFARALESDADILILNHPTRGVDVGAKEEIYSLIREIAKAGKSIILLADTLDESIGLGNHIIIMRDGLITGEYDAKIDAKPEKVSIVKYMM